MQVFLFPPFLFVIGQLLFLLGLVEVLLVLGVLSIFGHVIALNLLDLAGPRVLDRQLQNFLLGSTCTWR